MKKVLSLMLVLLTVVSLFAGCGGSEIRVPTVKLTDDLATRQAAIVELAKAYYYKNPYNQYDNRPLCVLGNASGRRGVVDDRNTPEYASEDMTMFNVCTSYAYHVLYGAIGFKLLDNARQCLTDRLSMGKDVPDEILIFQRENTDDVAKNHAAAEEMMALLQPGDLINYARDNGFGHTMIYVGDLNGDGKGDILHVDGAKYDMDAGVDKKESKGSVWLNKKNEESTSAEEYLMDPDFGGYLGTMLRFSLLRPALLSSEEYPLTESVKSRLIYPDLEITYTNGHGHYGAVGKEEELTYTLTVENHSNLEQKDLLVQIPAPENAQIVAVDGEAAKGSMVKWKLTIPAGETAVHTYTVKPAGEIGSRIVAKGGYVHAIPLPQITTAVTSQTLTAAQVHEACEKSADKTAIAFVEATYAALGKEVDIPEAKELLSTVFKTMKFGEQKVYVRKTAEELDETGKLHAQMMIPDYISGQMVRTNCDADEPRVNENRYRDLQPGDVIIYAEDLLLGSPEICVFNGEYLVYPNSGRVLGMTEANFEKLLSYDFFIGLRPTQVL